MGKIVLRYLAFINLYLAWFFMDAEMINRLLALGLTLFAAALWQEADRG